MAVDPILRLTSQSVIELLNNVDYVIHTIVPETYRYWSSNQPGTYLHPTGICIGSTGLLYVIDITDEESAHGILLEVRLHYPADVKVVKEYEVSLSGHLCFLDGVVYVTATNPGKIMFMDLAQKVQLRVSKIRSKRDVEKELQNRNLPTIGTMNTLKERLTQHLKEVSKHYPNNEKDQVMLDTYIIPTAICCDSGFLFCFDESSKSVAQVTLYFDGIGIKGEVLQLSKLEGVMKMNDIKKMNTKLVCSTVGEASGIVIYDLETGSCTLEFLRSGITGISLQGEKLVVCDTMNYSVNIFDTDWNCKVVAGNGEKGYADGDSQSSMFSQPFRVCTEANTIFVTDPSGGRIAIICNLEGTCRFLKFVGSLYRSFGIHEKGKSHLASHVELASASTKETSSFIEEHVQNAQTVQQLQLKSMNGPQGTVSCKTQQSLKLLQIGLTSLDSSIKTYSDNTYSVNSSTLLTSCVENLHAVSHFKHPTFSMLEYARDFSTIIRESIKRISLWSVKYFTHATSYYPVPKSHTPLVSSPLQFESSVHRVSKEEEKMMRSWIENYRPLRQRSVRDETTKDKAGTLPVSLYTNQKHQDNDYQIFQVGMQGKGSNQDEISDSDSHVDEDEQSNSGNEQNCSEYDSSSENESENETINGELCQVEDRKLMSRSGRIIKAAIRLDL